MEPSESNTFDTNNIPLELPDSFQQWLSTDLTQPTPLQAAYSSRGYNRATVTATAPGPGEGTVTATAPGPAEESPLSAPFDASTVIQRQTVPSVPRGINSASYAQSSAELESDDARKARNRAAALKSRNRSKEMKEKMAGLERRCEELEKENGVLRDCLLQALLQGKLE
mmetsp:Transcript_14856/g.39821  ORF Transcript_14856/g.39821 Transcript_14856/m.39821 type:complete len:169 (+) Transcript_14856:32-538(+)